MRILTPQDAAHILQDVTSWAVCWKVQKGSDVLRQTNHDREIVVNLSSDTKGLNGSYDPFLAFNASTMRSAGDLAVDNLEVDTILDSLGITAADVRAGLFDDVRYYLFLVNWREPTNSAIILRAGLVGNIRTFAREIANSELRGLKQYLQQNIVRTYGAGCDADLGDARCGFDLSTVTISGVVTSVSSARLAFSSTDLGLSPTESNYWVGGLVTFTTGENASYSMEVRTQGDATSVTLFEPMPADIQAGDEFTIYPGCNKTHVVVDGVAVGDCKNKFNNVDNYRGFPFIPGQNQLIRGPE